MSYDTSLFPASREKGAPKYVPLSALPEEPDANLEGPAPSKALIESVRSFGVATPVILRAASSGDGPVAYKVLDGRRRIKAARIVELKEIPAIVFSEGYGSDDVLTIQANALREANILAEYRAIKNLLARGLTISQIVSDLGMALATVRRRLRLDNLVSDALYLFESAQIGANVAERIAALPPTTQAKALDVFREKGGKLTASDVSELRRVKRDAAKDAIAAELFPEDDRHADRIASAKVHADALLSILREIDHPATESVESAIAALDATSSLSGEPPTAPKTPRRKAGRAS